MARPREYSLAQIALAKELFVKKEFTLNQIAKFVGFSTDSLVLYYCRPEFRKEHLNRCRRYQDKHRKQVNNWQKLYMREWTKKSKISK